MGLWGQSSALNFDLVSRVLFPTPEPSYGVNDFPEELIWIPKTLDPHSAPKDCIPCLLLLSPSARFIVLYLHSNAEDLGRCYSFLTLLRHQFQVHVLAVEYPGYGICPGGQACEETVTENAFVAFRFVRQVLHWPLDGIIILGRSIGCGPALSVATHHAVYGVAVVCPFLSIQELCKEHIGVFAHLITERFPNKDRVPLLRSPLLILHGKKDVVVPFSHGEKLYNLCRSRKRLVCPVDMEHNTNLHSDPNYFVLPMLQFFSLPDYSFEEIRVPRWAFDKRYAIARAQSPRRGPSVNVDMRESQSQSPVTTETAPEATPEEPSHLFEVEGTPRNRPASIKVPHMRTTRGYWSSSPTPKPMAENVSESPRPNSVRAESPVYFHPVLQGPMAGLPGNRVSFSSGCVSTCRAAARSSSDKGAGRAISGAGDNRDSFGGGEGAETSKYAREMAAALGAPVTGKSMSMPPMGPLLPADDTFSPEPAKEPCRLPTPVGPFLARLTVPTSPEPHHQSIVHAWDQPTWDDTPVKTERDAEREAWESEVVHMDAPVGAERQELSAQQELSPEDVSLSVRLPPPPQPQHAGLQLQCYPSPRSAHPPTPRPMALIESVEEERENDSSGDEKVQERTAAAVQRYLETAGLDEPRDNADPAPELVPERVVGVSTDVVKALHDHADVVAADLPEEDDHLPEAPEDLGYRKVPRSGSGVSPLFSGFGPSSKYVPSSKQFVGPGLVRARSCGPKVGAGCLNFGDESHTSFMWSRKTHVPLRKEL